MAADAAALCLMFAPMSDYLENTLGVDNVIMRSRLIRSGFKLPDTVATKKTTWVKSVCYTIRKQTGNAVTKEISMELEENLDWFVKWCIYMYLTQRQLDLAEATLDHIRMDSIQSLLLQPSVNLGTMDSSGSSWS